MKITSTKAIVAAIRDKRKRLGFTQAQLAAHTGFSTSFISDLCYGYSIRHMILKSKYLERADITDYCID